MNENTWFLSDSDLIALDTPKLNILNWNYWNRILTALLKLDKVYFGIDDEKYSEISAKNPIEWEKANARAIFHIVCNLDPSTFKLPLNIPGDYPASSLLTTLEKICSDPNATQPQTNVDLQSFITPPSPIQSSVSANNEPESISAALLPIPELATETISSPIAHPVDQKLQSSRYSFSVDELLFSEIYNSRPELNTDNSSSLQTDNVNKAEQSSEHFAVFTDDDLRSTEPDPTKHSLKSTEIFSNCVLGLFKFDPDPAVNIIADPPILLNDTNDTRNIKEGHADCHVIWPSITPMAHDPTKHELDKEQIVEEGTSHTSRDHNFTTPITRRKLTNDSLLSSPMLNNAHQQATVMLLTLLSQLCQLTDMPKRMNAVHRFICGLNIKKKILNSFNLRLILILLIIVSTIFKLADYCLNYLNFDFADISSRKGVECRPSAAKIFKYTEVFPTE